MLSLLTIMERVPDMASCHQIGDYRNYHQKSFIQKLMEADAEIYSQWLDPTLGNLFKRESKGLWTRSQGHDGGTHRASCPEVMRVHGLWTDRQKACMGQTWAICMCETLAQLGLLVEFLAEGSVPLPGSWASFLLIIPHAGLPFSALI